MAMKKLPVQTIDAGKLLHEINSGAKAQLSVFEERVKFLGKELGLNWSLTSINKNEMLIEDIDTHKYYKASIENLGKGHVKIHNINELKIVEEKKENLFTRRIVEMVNAISEDRIKDADNTFNNMAKQRFRSNVIPEHGWVTTRDGVSRYIRTSREIVERNDQINIIKVIAESLKDGVKVSRGGVIEATFNSKPFNIPITELTRRKVMACDIKQKAQNAYMSEGFQKRIKRIASLVTENDIEGAVKLVADFVDENQEFSLLTEQEIQELMGNALATNLCLNKVLAEDVGTLFYKTNCRVNHDEIISEWRKAARMTEYAPFVENVRKIEESKNFEGDYGKFLNALFLESSRDLKLEASEHLVLLRRIRDILTATKDLDENVVQQVDNYIKEMESGGDAIDDAIVLEVRKFLSGLSEQVIEAATSFDQFASPDVSTLDTHGAVPPVSSAEPKTFGGGADLGSVPSIEAETPPAGEEPEETPEKSPEEEEKEEKEGEDIFGGLLDSIQREEKPVTENKTETALILEIRKVISGLNPDELKLELKEWQQNAPKYFKQDGQQKATIQLNAYIDHAKALNQVQLSEEFHKVLIQNTPTGATIVEETPEADDPYAFTEELNTEKLKESPDGVTKKPAVKAPAHGSMGKAGEKDQNFNCEFGHNTAILTPTKKKINEEVKESETGLPEDGKKSKTTTAMGKAGEEDQNVADNAGIKQSTLKESIQCPSCKSIHDISAYLGEDATMCPSCGYDVFNLVMETLNVHKMEKAEGTGVVDKKVGQTQNTMSGEKPGNECPEGKGLVKPTPIKQEKSVGGKKDGMDQEGKSISGGVEGTVEGGMRPPTTRKGIIYPFKQNSGYTTEDIDKIAASIVEAEGDEIVTPDETSKVEPPLEPEVEPSPEVEPVPETEMEPSMEVPLDVETPPEAPPADTQEITVRPNAQITVKVGDEDASSQVTLTVQPEATEVGPEPPALPDEGVPEVTPEEPAPEPLPETTPETPPPPAPESLGEDKAAKGGMVKPTDKVYKSEEAARNVAGKKQPKPKFSEMKSAAKAK